MLKILLVGIAVLFVIFGVAFLNCALNSSTVVELDEVPKGSCIEVVESSEQNGDEEIRARLVPCSGEGDTEVIDTFTPDSDSEVYPGMGHLRAVATLACDPSSTWYVLPLEDQWEDGTRTILCVKEH